MARPRRPAVRSAPSLLALLALLGASCGSPAPSGTDAVTDRGGPGEDELAVAVASFDLAVGTDVRVLAAVFTSERALLGGGEVAFELGHLGDQPGGTATVDIRTTARWLAVPGSEPVAESGRPRPLDDPMLSGVYAARIDLDRPGYWGLLVRAELEDGTVREGRTVLRVLDEPAVVAVGEPAPRTDNLTTDDVVAGRAPGIALDSRMQGPDDPDPAPTLHATTVAAALAASRPVVVVIATPVYCQSRICGPLTEVMVPFAERHAERIDVVHLEVWRDFETQQLNDGAAEWIQTETGGNEPWVFLVGADGEVVARWDNVLDLDELEAMVAGLPLLGPR